MSTNPAPPLSPRFVFAETDAAAVQLAEYNQLYALGLYRLAALDQRTPILSAALTGLLACVGVLSGQLQFALLLFFPLTLVWLLRSTIGHARSFEDCLRRIEELEHALNGRFKERLIDFQSSHPSRLQVVGGRTGEESVLSVLVISLLLLGACLYLFATQVGPELGSLAVYTIYIVMVLWSFLLTFQRYVTYWYKKCNPNELPSVRQE